MMTCRGLSISPYPEDLRTAERAQALRYLLGLLSNQESKAEAVGCNVAAPVAALLKVDDAEVRRLACDTLATLAHLADGRASVVAVDGRGLHSSTSGLDVTIFC